MPTLQRVSESTLYPGLFIEYIEGGIEGAQALWLGVKQRITLCPFGGVASRTNSSASVSKAECYFCQTALSGYSRHEPQGLAI